MSYQNETNINLILYIMKTLCNRIDEKILNDYDFNQMGFYAPYKDETGIIDLMRYTNNCLSYGYNKKENVFYICESPILDASIIKIISKFTDFESARKGMFDFKKNNL